MNDLDRASAFLSHVRELPPFAALSDLPARFIAGGSQMRELPRGRIICEKGQHPGGVHCILDGRVKLSATSAQGAERVLDILTAGRVFGLAAVLLDEPCPVYVETLAACRVLVIGRERLQSAVAEWPAIAGILLRLMAEDVHRLVHDLESCCLMSARQRVLDLLLKEGQVRPASPDQALLVLPVTKGLVASRLNLSPETFSRELHELAQCGLISIERRSIHIHSLERLSQIAATPHP
ncbi:MAG: Crp/Fnr family transcriptional regulator [Sphingobacteriia bacterium]|nr:Crp/Fnr family transcriptional regulator [Sphingobacteriia bacterium]NCC40979.1 Crp/Fnr family transcriptional regulator [Gammaproteobacteria bacterium]